MHLPNIKFSSTQVVSYCLLLLSGLLLLACVYMTYSIDVVTDWKLTLPKQQIHVGDTVIISSTYKKLRDVTGTADRFIDCKTRTGVDVRYPINKVSANRAASDHSKTGTGIVIIIPNTIPDLPTTCRIAVSVDYPVLPWRHVIENNQTDSFTLYPAKKSSAKSVSDGSQKTSQTLAQGPNQTATYSSSQNTPQSSNPQQDTSQKQQSVSSTNQDTPPPASKPAICKVAVIGNLFCPVAKIVNS